MTDYLAQVALGESLIGVGQLRFTQSGARQYSRFDYDPTWLKDPIAFAIAPDLPIEGGPFHASAQTKENSDALASVFADAAPDSWGRRLLERSYGSGLCEFEYLTLSDDQCRQGALRFLDSEDKIIKGAAPQAIPRLIDLTTLTAISRAYEQGQEISSQDMQALAGAAGSGGARPKANVIDGPDLWLAKFTSVYDQSPIERVEVATLDLAKACGIRTPQAQLALTDTKFPVALLKRFDRRGNARIPYISARTALIKTGNELGSYTEIVDFISAYSADPVDDCRELFKRLVFTILVSNKDDHLKNHGFLYVGAGRWRLSPMFDVNPAPDRNPHLETAIMQGGPFTRSIELALEASAFFAINDANARAIIKTVAQKISANWRVALKTVGVSGSAAKAYEAAFVNAEADIALGM
jgi:serine/threonine-protein kinase HipA